MTITFYKNTSDNRVVNKTITQLFQLTGTLRESCSILQPDILIQRSNLDVSTSNYMYIAEFKRYYYITNISTSVNQLWLISARVDVLMTYKEQFLPLSAMIGKQESEANLYLSNSMVPLLPQTIVETVPVTGLTFSTNNLDEAHQGMGDNNTTIVLATVGVANPPVPSS